MKASELRIGNLVAFGADKSESSTYKVMAYDIVGICEAEIAGKNHNCTGIPLTEEWLLKFGFEKYGDNEELRFYKGDFFVENMILKRDEEFIVNLTCVHKLQNIYFALTGEELELVSLADEAGR